MIVCPPIAIAYIGSYYAVNMIHVNDIWMKIPKIPWPNSTISNIVEEIIFLKNKKYENLRKQP
jgi:hypothetical protein